MTNGVLLAVGMEAVMENPLWMLVPWAVFAVAAGLKFWCLTTVFRERDHARAMTESEFRRSLERIWAKGSR